MTREGRWPAPRGSVVTIGVLLLPMTMLAGGGSVVAQAAADRGGCQIWSKTPPASGPTDVSPQTELVGERLSVSADGRTLRVVITVANMAEKLPPGTTNARWMTTWGYGSAMQAVAATLDATGGVRYVDGVFVGSKPGDPGAAITVKHTDTGSFVTGAEGSVEIDVPVANLAPVRLGSRLLQPVGETGAWAEADYPVFNHPAFVSGPFDQDQGGPGVDYVVGRGCGPASSHGTRARSAPSPFDTSAGRGRLW